MAQIALTVLFCLAYFSVYIFLWVRQLVFYTNRRLNIDFSKALRFFSYLSIFLIFFGELGVILLSTTTAKLMLTPKGCVQIPLDSTSITITVIVCTVVFFSGLIMLVGLLIYPLHKHSKQTGCLALCGLINCPLQKDDQQNALQISQNQFITHRSRTNKKINKILRRNVCYSVIIMVSTLVLLLATLYVHMETSISKMLYDVVTFANLEFVVSSIGGWKKIVCLTPPMYSVTVNAAQQKARV